MKYVIEFELPDNDTVLHNIKTAWSRQAATQTVLEITESDKISYAVICDKFPSPHVYFNTYNEAEHWARFNQPNYRPYYIIKRSEHFEIVGEVR